MKTIKTIGLWLGPDCPIGAGFGAVASVILFIVAIDLLAVPFVAFMRWWWTLFLGQ
jgi:hypothetical protein